MIYQMQVFYGALFNGKVIYSIEMNFNDCSELQKEFMDSEPFKTELINRIKADGFDPVDFTFDWLTKKQYEERIDSKVEKEFNW